MVFIRTLHEDELKQWFDHVEECFSEKPTPRDYFVRHYTFDPYRDVNTIVVAVDKDTIVSTARIFKRKIYLNGKIVTMGGIGEVSTRKSHRGQGLAQKVLFETNNVMKKNQIQIGSLHTGNDLLPFYSKFGYKSVPLKRANITIHYQDVKEPHLHLIPITFDHCETLAKFYAKYASRYNGCIVRDVEYWTTWTKSELDNPHKKNCTAWLLVTDEKKISVETIVCYAFLQWKEKVIVRDYLANLDHQYATISFKNLMYAYLRHANVKTTSVTVCDALIDHERQELEIDSIEEEHGFMYQVFDDSLGNPFDKLENHAFMGSDSF
jgi:predicted acetyltransferase